MQLPPDFETELKSSIGLEEFQNFKDSFSTVTPTSVRINTIKNKQVPSGISIPWCPSGYYLDERPIFTLDPAFHAGSYYVQEASSMFIWHILDQFVHDKKDIRILDLCAAPGGKSTLVASFLDNMGLLVANEVIKNRAYVLKYNISKEGYSNVIVTNNDPKDFGHLNEYFDIILVDAPCSGEGMFRKDSNAVCEWSPENVGMCAARQKRILGDVLPALKSGGMLIYSTCTFNRYENIENIQWLEKEKGLSSLAVKTETEWNIVEVSEGKSYGYQFFPHKIKGEGFFISVMRKEDESTKDTKQKNSRDYSRANTLSAVDKKSMPIFDEWIKLDNIRLLHDKTGTIHAINSDVETEAYHLNHFLRLIYCGVSVGTINKTILLPDHSLTLSFLLPDDFQTFELNKMDALQYLKRSLPAIDSSQKSWTLATYEGNGLGLMKNLGHRINNYLPQEYRIHMEIR
jgi:NOL1/NOP2/sun family putative RNA methylase